MIRTICWLSLCCLLLSCGWPKQESIDLIREFPYADHTGEELLIAFGTPDATPFLLSGWGDPEKGTGTPFRWITDKTGSMVIPIRKPQPLFLHIRTRSFFPNPADLYVNGHFVQKLPIYQKDSVFHVALAPEIQVAGNNLVEFRFSEIRKPAVKDKRELAAAIYSISLNSREGTEMENTADVFSSELIDLGGRKARAIVCHRSGTLRYFEELDPASTLEFAAYFLSGSGLEDDDTASFRIAIRDMQGKSHVVFQKEAQAKLLQYQNIKLSGIVGAKQLYEIDFEVHKPAAARAAWIEPRLTRQPDSVPKAASLDGPLDKLRRENRNANVIICLLDAASAKHFSGYGYSRDTTPVADQLAREGVRFDSAYTEAVYTLASTASLMSGLYPYHHRITSISLKNRRRLPADIFTMAESFQAAGYRTGTFVANGNASSIFGMTQGFETVAEVFRDPEYTGWGKDITNRVVAWLSKNRNEPMFAYLHYREPHAPFNPPPEWINKYTDPHYQGMKDASYEARQKINMGEVSATDADRDYIRALYDANLAYGDSQIGVIVRKLKDLGIYDRTILIVIADHGEAFWEHGFQGHNSQLYQESIRIPMIFKLAGNSGLKGEQIKPDVRTIDMYPTLVDLMNLSRKPMGPTDGKSFLPLFVGGAEDGREVITQTVGGSSYSYFDGRYKYLLNLTYDKQQLLDLIHSSIDKRDLQIERSIAQGLLMGDNRCSEFLRNLQALGLAEEELYDLQNDPQERNNLVRQDPFHTAYYRTRLLGWMITTRTRKFEQTAERAVLDESTKENLKALGYLGQTDEEQER